MGSPVQYRIELDTSGFEKNLQAAKGQFEAFSSFMQGMGVGAGIEVFKALEDGIKDAIVAIPGMVGDLGRASEALLNLHESTGISTKALQEWKFAGAVVGVSVDEMAVAVGRFDKGLDSMAPKVVDALSRIGLSATSVAKMADDMKVDTVMEHLGRIEAGGTRTALAMELFGKAGAQMLPLAATFGTLKEAASALGVVMDDKVLKAAADLDDKMDMLGATTEGLKNNFVSVIVTSEPVHVLMDTLAKSFGNLSVWVKNNNEALRQWVDSGIIFVAKAFVEAVKVVEVGAAVFKGLLDVWTLATRTAKDLGAGVLLLNEVMASKSIAEARAAWNEYGQTLSRNAAEAKTALEAHQAGLNTFVGVTGQVKNAGDLLVTNLQAQAGQHHEVATAIGVHIAAGKDLVAIKAKEADELRRLIAATKDWAKEQEEAAAITKKETADDVANFANVSKAFTSMQNAMTLANSSGLQKRMAEAEIAYQADLHRIEGLKIKNADELAALVTLARRNYDLAQAAAQGYYSSVSQYAEANGIKTREELQHEVDVTIDGYNRMLASGLFTKGQLREAHKQMIDANDKLNDTHTLSTIEKYEMISKAATSIIGSIFGHNKKAAIASAIIDTAAAVVSSFKNAGGWPWGLIPAAAMLAAGIVQIQKIQSTQYRQGTPGLGFVDFGPSSQVELHGREAVVPEARAAEFAAMHSGGGGGSGPTGGDVYLDGEAVGRWLARRKRAGFPGFEPN